MKRKPNYKIVDCIDLQVEIQAVPFTDLSKLKPGEPSSEIRKRVLAARQRQTERYKNHPLIHWQMTDRMLHEYCILDDATNEMIKTAMEKFSLSA